jgi:predicted unusual protein kinase regulating ubiquinone biosynthesis (AarF/ABC1/UbiB family)
LGRKRILDSASIDTTRYRKIRWFFAKIFFHVLWWDIFLNIPLLRFFRTDPLFRWQSIAQRYRKLAVEMGGVLIKLGQFLSIRVDILPHEVTSELAGLQDSVPAEPLAAFKSQLENDLTLPFDEIFAFISKEAMGAASLAQVHRVVLHDGKTAVVKLLRPGIRLLVETDLAALSQAIRWLNLYKRIRKRVNLNWLIDEFTAITMGELDLKAEGENAERLSRDLADNPYVYIPTIYWNYSGSKTLTMECVDFIKIGDNERIEAAGIPCSRVADQLYNIYMQQVFETFWVHVDPHPGNLFIIPLPTSEEIAAGISSFLPDDPVPYQPGREFKIAFVDFGMMAIIPERLRTALREYAIGIGTRDAHKIVQSYVSAGVLAANTDLDRIEEIHEVLFDRMWGVQVGQFRDLAVSELRFFLKEYRDVIYDAPFQFQADMLFILRAVGILSGLATHLDPNFDPWAKTIPYAERFAKSKIRQKWRGWEQEIETIAHHFLELPGQINRLLTIMRQGKLSVRTYLSPEDRKKIKKLQISVDRLSWIIPASAMFISGILIQISCPRDKIGIWLVGFSILIFLFSIYRKNK